MTRDPTLAQKIRAALLRGESDAAIARRLNTTMQAVAIVRKGLGVRVASPLLRGGLSSQGLRPMAGQEGARDEFFLLDGSNVSGWGRRFGEPRLAQTLAVCRWAQRQRAGRAGAAFCCWFDASFRHAVARYSAADARVLDEVLRREPELFKQAPAGTDAYGKRIRADNYVLREAEMRAGAVIISSDLYRREAREDAVHDAWLKGHPGRRLPGQVASNGDILLGARGEIHIPVVDSAEYYLS